MKQTLAILTAALGMTMTSYAQHTDKRPPISLRYLDKQKFKEAGLWFWTTEAPPTNIPVGYLSGNDKDSPQRRVFACVGFLGSSLPIYCVNGLNERDDTLLIEAFLEGYTIGANPNKVPPQDKLAELTGRSTQELNKEADEAKLIFDAIIAMNGGKLPANWPVDPQFPTNPMLNPNDEQSLVWEKEAKRRINAIRAAHGGQLPPDWKELIAANTPSIVEPTPTPAQQVESTAAKPASAPLATEIYVGKRYSASVYNSPTTVLIKGSVDAMADLPSVADSQIGDCWYIKTARTYMAVTTVVSGTPSYEIALNLSETTN
jgi:hypothetical protein